MSASQWRAAGAALAPLDNISVLLLLGPSSVALAAVARGVAGAAAPQRRVAVFDLAGAFGVDEPDGLIAAFRDGRSLNALARPLDDGGGERFVVPRGPGTLDHALAAHERWPRLVEGFRATGALLVFTVPEHADGWRALAGLADCGLRLVERYGGAALEPLDDAPAAEPSSSPPAIDERAPVPIAGAGAADFEPPTSPPRAQPPRRRRARRIAAAVLVLGALGAWGLWPNTHHPATPRVARRADSLVALDAAAAVAPDTLELPVVVNPADSARAALWGVELVATNDRTDASFRLAEFDAWPAGTLSPVLLGQDSAPWYRVVVGAFVDRTGAQLLRAQMRQVGTIESDAGIVTRMPLALRLDTALTPGVAKARASAYVTRGIAAYALQGDDGQATIYAGAFATPEQAVVLLAELRAAGMQPHLAFRIGRTY